MEYIWQTTTTPLSNKNASIGKMLTFHTHYNTDEIRQTHYNTHRRKLNGKSNWLYG